MLTKNLFQFNNSDLLVHQDVQGEVWFRGTNVCSILGYSNSSETLKAHVPDYLQELAIGAGKPAYYVAEKGLYILAFRSKTPKALEFQLWAADVIKSIRTTGGYIAPEATPEQVQTLFDTYQAKLTECDRQILNAELGTGKISKLAADRRTLETLVRKESAASSKPISSQAALGNLLQAWYKVHGTKPMTGQEIIEAAQEGCNATLKAALIDCASDQSGKISAKSLGYYLRANAGTRVHDMRIVKVKTTRRGLICWGIEMAENS